MTPIPISPYADLVEEWRAQAARWLGKGPSGPRPRTVYNRCATQLEAIEAQDTEHAAIWHQRYHEAIGAEPPADLRALSDVELAARTQSLRGHVDAVRDREKALEAEILACEMERDRR